MCLVAEKTLEICLDKSVTSKSERKKEKKNAFENGMYLERKMFEFEFLFVDRWGTFLPLRTF